MQLTKAVHNISVGAMSSRSKPIMLHGAHMKEMARSSTVVFMKVRKSLFVRWREKTGNWKKGQKKSKEIENIFFSSSC